MIKRATENSVKQRLTEILKIKRSTLTIIAEGNENVRVTLSRQISGKTALSFSTIDIFLEKFPDISAEWLLRGEGDMYKHINNIAIQTQNGGVGNTQNMNTYTDAIELLQSEIATKNEQLRVKDSQIEKLFNLLNK
ncbi:MAG: hypothetical protein ACI30A_06515 [Paludibacteraceae bacterium]